MEIEVHPDTLTPTWAWSKLSVGELHKNILQLLVVINPSDHDILKYALFSKML